MTGPDQDVRLSYSSAHLLQSCSMKYYLYKVKGVNADPDVEEDDKALKVGKAFHFIMEKSNHSRIPTMGDLVIETCKSFGVEDEQAMIHAMVLRYLEVHQKSGLECFKTEFEMSDSNFVGYIDAIMKDGTGDWWIVDLKTASTISETTLVQLHSDTQLNLYSFFSREMANLFGLDPEKFRGCRYRVTTKTKLKKKESEFYASFVERCYGSITSCDVLVPIEIMCPEKAMARHLRLFAASMALREGKAEPLQNFHSCGEYFRPCKYWSQCHGKTFTECKSALKVLKTGE